MQSKVTAFIEHNRARFAVGARNEMGALVAQMLGFFEGVNQWHACRVRMDP